MSLRNLFVGRTCEGPTGASISHDLDLAERSLLDRAGICTSDDRSRPARRTPPRRFKYAASVSYKVCNACRVDFCHESYKSHTSQFKGLESRPPERAPPLHTIPYCSVSGCSDKCRRLPILPPPARAAIARVFLLTLLIPLS